MARIRLARLGLRWLVGVGAACALVGMGGPSGAAPASQPSSGAVAQSVTPEQQKFFEAKVRPLLAENCFSCHGEEKQKSHLRLDSLAAVLKGGDNGPAIVPGHPEKSELIAAVSFTDPDLQMPPPKDKERLSAEQVATLTMWVKMGAPWPAGSGPAAVAVARKHKTITDADRAFWSFQPVKEPAVPAVADDGWCRNEIDRFILAKLKTEGLTPAPEADRVTLIRRATFDLTGLPPTPQEVSAFVNDASPEAYDHLIDRLLASPRYGERYARHWLDLVRYAESDGFKQDAYRPNIWPYRDWVIQSLNEDMSYDRFVAEQLAGDEIAPDDPHVMVATTYLRLGMYEYNQRDAPKQRAEYLNDITDVTADALLGLGMGCARCHDHKFDPILQSDYFRLQAFFAPLQPRNDLALATPAEKAEYDAKFARWEEETASIRAKIDAIEERAKRKAADGALAKFPPHLQAVWAKPEAERSPFERQIAYLIYRQIEEEHKNIQDKIKGPQKDRLIELEKQLAEFDKDKPKPLPSAFVVTDIGPVAPPTSIPGDESHPLDPGYPVVLDGLKLPQPNVDGTPTSTGRRTALAKWVINPANPLTTRVIANRLWQWHFGRGLVRTSSDFGRLGEPPSHPELLDWLAKRIVENGWSLKKMHRLMMTSAAYRQAAVRPTPAVAKLKDPENRWLWRFNTHRLDAEQVRDAILAVSGELQLGPQAGGGPSVDPSTPRRSIYTKALRNNHDPILEAFDLAESFGSIPERNVTTTATQSLLMINGDWPLKRAAAFASRVRADAKTDDPTALADTAYRLAYGRAPESDEREAAVAFLKRGASRSPAAGAAAGKSPDGEANAADRPVTQAMPHRGGEAIVVHNANPAEMMRLPGASSMPSDEFTVEAFVLLESLYDNASVRVIASQWDGRQDHPGWSLGVTSEKSKYQPRNLVLQVVADGAAPAGGYEVIPSGLLLELHRTYYVGASVRMADTGEAGVTFYVKDVSDMDAPLRSVGVKHTVTGPVASKSPLILGGRDATAGQPAQGWDGLIGEVRISKSALRPNQLMWNDGDPKDAVVGHWEFEEQTGFFKDSAGRQKDLVRLSPGQKSGAAPAPNADPALVDFCHVLMNSNEFLYVD